MKYFRTQDRFLFYKEPQFFTKETPLDTLKYAIGANLYMPGTQRNVFEKLIHNKFHEIGAITFCLEDAIEENEVEAAEKNVLDILDRLSMELNESSKLEQDLPLIFIRVRNVEQFLRFSTYLEKKFLKILAGFCFPKFHSENGERYFEILHSLQKKSNEIIYGMPILEDSRLISIQTRKGELKKIQNIMLKEKNNILNIRVGGTDFSSVFGLRRSVDATIYDIHVVADCLIEIINTFLPYGFVISGPVWEYFSNNPDSKEIQGLKRELKLDIQNGFHGKTIIHPSQINVVNKEHIISYNDYQDACNVLKKEGGVSHGNHRMNESGPHRNWAEKILAKAEIFGVLDENVNF